MKFRIMRHFRQWLWEQDYISCPVKDIYADRKKGKR